MAFGTPAWAHPDRVRTCLLWWLGLPEHASDATIADTVARRLEPNGYPAQWQMARRSVLLALEGGADHLPDSMRLLLQELDRMAPSAPCSPASNC